jgi:hypothetical protein
MSAAIPGGIAKATRWQATASAVRNRVSRLTQHTETIDLPDQPMANGARVIAATV